MRGVEGKGGGVGGSFELLQLLQEDIYVPHRCICKKKNLCKMEKEQ